MRFKEYIAGILFPVHFRPVDIEIVPGASRSRSPTKLRCLPLMSCSMMRLRGLPLKKNTLTRLRSLPLRSHTLVRLRSLPPRSCSFSFAFLFISTPPSNYRSSTINPSLAMASSFLSASRRPRLYGDSGPVRFVDYILGIRSFDITDYGDIVPVRS